MLFRSVFQSRYESQNSGTAPGVYVTGQSNINDFLKWGNETGMRADLTSATAATINSIREAFQFQRVLERDARGGTRYVEFLRSF